MKLKNVEQERAMWIQKGYEVFSFDKQQLKEKTLNNPEWLHFGAGNLFRAYQSVFAQTLIEKGLQKTGVIVVGGRNGQNIDDYFWPFANNHIAVTLRADGKVEKKVIGSVVESLKMTQLDQLQAIFAKPSLKYVTFTITEKAYRVEEAEILPLTQVSNYMGVVASLLYHRYQQKGGPINLISMDNCSHNGDVLKMAIMKFVDKWADEGFKQYVSDSVAFPISMIDKITPRPDASVYELLQEDGVEDLKDPNYYLNCFSNAEEKEYLVIEDNFVTAKPDWEEAGVIFTKREIVDKVEKMKVCTCLNPIHTALAIFGNLLGYKLIWKEMQDERLVELVKHIGYDEGLPVVVDPGIIDPKEFIDTVINERITNPFMPDAPQRIGMDTSQKIPVRFGETLKAYLAKGSDLNELTYIPLTLAGWLRYLMGIDDEGQPFEIPSDPLLTSLCPIMQQYHLHDVVKKEDISVILQNKTIFGVDLVETNLADKIVGYLNEMLDGEGAVGKTIEKYN